MYMNLLWFETIQTKNIYKGYSINDKDQTRMIIGRIGTLTPQNMFEYDMPTNNVIIDPYNCNNY